MRIFIGADHRGFALKELLRKYLVSKGRDVVDAGAYALDPNDDYPDFALKVAQGVSASKENFGFLLCGSGLGVVVAANKVRGARAGLCTSAEAAVHARANDNLNIMALAAEQVDAAEAQAWADLFLMTPFSHDPKYLRRQQKIEKIESDTFKA